jgi:hypothetical protein
MASLENRTIEDGWVMGYVNTNLVGSRCEFQICEVSEWEELTEEEAGDSAREAMYESGMLEWGY